MKSKVILVIEDEALILLDIENALVEEGFEVVTANNGSRAIKTFDADPSRIDAVLTDINLGKGSRGWDIAHHIRKHTSSMPIVYISGDSAHEWEAEGVPNSVLVPKPFVHAQLIAALTTLLNKT
tara:strand:+ start:11609 stop:11980 length:372 start_codon:yes stop_codon:yes gene_type:complete